MQYIQLDNRSIITISGADTYDFLQGLITNDINKIGKDRAIYTFLLNPQGRFLFDFFISKLGDDLILDCNKSYADEILKKLSLYKLRSKIELKKSSNLEVLAIPHPELKLEKKSLGQNSACYFDPRSEKIGFRIIGTKSDLENFITDNNLQKSDLDFYNYQRSNLKIPDDSDLTFDKSLPLEYGFDNFNAIDYKKGCYVGQETTARTHYKGVIRKNIFLVSIKNLLEIPKQSEILNGDKKMGEILSSVFYNQKLFALALIKNIDIQGENGSSQEIDLSNLELKVNNNLIEIIQ